MDFDSTVSDQWDWQRPPKKSARDADTAPAPPPFPDEGDDAPEHRSQPVTDWDWLSPPRAPEGPLRGKPSPPPIPRADIGRGDGNILPGDTPISAESLSVVREAAMRLAASQFDPNHISGKQLDDMLTLLKNGHVITATEQDLLYSDPISRAFPDSSPDHPRDLLGDWQARHDSDMARGDMSRLSQSAEALSILTRLRMTRELM